MPPTPKRTSKGGVEQETKVKKAKEEVNMDDIPIDEIKKAVDPQDLYSIEDKIAAELGTSEMTDRLKVSTGVLRNILEKFIAGETHDVNMREALVASVQMRRYSRLIYYANAMNKKEVTTKMEAVESKYMQLQNQSSEIGHLQKEIDRCLQYPSNDEQIALIPVEEFYEKAKPEISRVDITKTDEHQQKVARLNWEREERKQLVGHLNELEFRRSVLISDINKKESRIKSLKPKMDTVVKSARSLEEALGMKCSSSNDRRSPSFHLLPPPLSVLYVQAEAYKQLIEDTGVVVSVGGDEKEANRLNEKKEGKEEGEEKESEEMEGVEEGGEEENDERKGESVSATLEKKRNALLTPHPVYLSIDIGCTDDYKVRMKLQYLPELDICVLKWRVKASDIPTFGSLKSSSFLDDLFDGDDGLTCPNAVGEAKMNQLKVNFSSLSKSIGRPYQFVQRLTGAHEDSSGTQLADELQKVMNAVRERIKRRVDGVLSLIEMEKGRVAQLMEREGLTMMEGVQLKKVQTIDDEEEFMAKIPHSTCDLLKKKESDPFLHLLFSFLTPSGEVEVVCALWSDFPSSSVLASFSISKDGEVRNEENCETIKAAQNRLREKVGDEKKEGMACLVKELMEVAGEIGEKKEEKVGDEKKEGMACLVKELMEVAGEIGEKKEEKMETD